MRVLTCTLRALGIALCVFGCGTYAGQGRPLNRLRELGNANGDLYF